MDYTKIVYGIILLLVGAADVFLIPWLKEKVDIANLTKFLSYVKILVQAAEQIYGSGDGEVKKSYVLEQLNKLNLKFDEDVVNNAIESAVLELNK